MRHLDCWMMSWSQFNPLQADWWRWSIIRQEISDAGLTIYATPLCDAAGLPVIFPQLEFANKINDMVSTAGTVKWAICEYTVPHLQFGFEFFVFIYSFFVVF